MSYIPRLSASRLKSMNECSMKFYMGEMLKLPEKTWPRTIAGSVVHSVLEALRRTKHKKHYDMVMAGNSIYSSPAISRLVKIWKDRHNMADEISADIDPMAMLVLTQTNFMDNGATQTFDPEHEFLLKLPSGAVIKGFIDKLAIFGDKAKISDYKSQRNKFTQEELKNNFQASVYQLYVYKTFNLPAEVEFILLRHGPTKRTPEKHLQIVAPSTPHQLIGFEYYLEHMYKVLTTFGLKDAYTKFHEDEGFCERVCSYRRPFRYWSVKKRTTGELVKNYLIDDNNLDIPFKLNDDEYVETLENKGCPRFNS